MALTCRIEKETFTSLHVDNLDVMYKVQLYPKYNWTPIEFEEPNKYF